MSAMTAALTMLVREIENHVAEGGWDQGARLFALVPTVELLAREPGLAALLGVDPNDPGRDPDGALTPVEQEELPDHASIEELLAGLAWPDDVVGAALVVERVVLPPEVEADLPTDETAALAVMAGHPLRQDVRLAVATLRDGTRSAAMRFRLHDDPVQVLVGPDLVPGLADALAATLEADAGPDDRPDDQG
jgi:hypothetical protein